MDPVLRSGLEAIVEHLRHDGLNARLGADGAYLGLGEAALVVPWSQCNPPQAGVLHSAALQVALRLREDEPLLFHDLITSLGDSREEAVVRALLGWRHGVLPTLLPLIGGPTLPDLDVFDAEDALYCPPWVIHSGPYQVTGDEPDRFFEQLETSPPLLTLREILAQEIDRSRLHWLKLFRYRISESGDDEADCLLDGVPFEPGESQLLKWEWPAVKGLHYFRQFMLLLPQGRSHAELISERLELRRAVWQTVETMQGHPEADQDAIDTALRRRGVDPELAFWLTEFVPLAFGRVLLAQMGVEVADCYMTMGADGNRSQERKLCEEPVYSEALAVAHSELEMGMARDAFLVIAGRSAEMEAVHNAREQGEDLQGARILPPVISLPKTDPK